MTDLSSRRDPTQNNCTTHYPSYHKLQYPAAMKSMVAVSMLAAGAIAATCDYAVVGPNLQSLGKPIASCMTATDNSYNLARASAPPTPEQAAAICAKCQDFVAAVRALPPWPDCTMNVGGSEQTLTSYFDKMIGGCAGGSNSSSPASNGTVTTANATGTSSVGTNGTSKDTVVGSTNNATTANSTTATPTTTPASTPKSSGQTNQVGVVAVTALVTALSIVF
ncbi:hypothetical protein LEN26_009856 [Aphanomyces euteiches]|nr:hypothetical protein AeMF1_015264 [Aphanomyces euteiches]KAH9109708.1 hypothetical protein AeMF1_015265 [Aphanomyces euteiches]KAH9118179.1 hypothetical protein AeMF1_008520 [Aphanomyces euteiches]KAH9123701.1 hypothetical protein LEN26_009855 [Aphanomyces euteiches]KAH9123702.1 hypothetical protein LEN26_009856 [Aphanomyces euteiches]